MWQIRSKQTSGSKQTWRQLPDRCQELRNSRKEDDYSTEYFYKSYFGIFDGQ